MAESMKELANRGLFAARYKVVSAERDGSLRTAEYLHLSCGEVVNDPVDHDKECQAGGRLNSTVITAVLIITR